MNDTASSSTAAHRTRVLLVDDHELVVEGFRRLLAEHDDLEVVGTAMTSSAGIQLARKLKPDVVVIDYLLPDADGATATARLLEDVPDAKVIMLTGSEDPRALRAALSAGCVGFLEKTSAPHRLPTAVRAVAAGETFMSTADLGRLREPRGQGLSTLTSREREILELMAEGKTNKAIAEELFVSTNTVRTHAQAILEKLGAHSKLEAVIIAHRLGSLNHPMS